MYTRDQVLNKLRSKKPELKERYPISELGIFGSYGRGAQETIGFLEMAKAVKELVLKNISG